MKVIFIVGLPCSGKTTLAKKLASVSNAILLDDASKLFDKEQMKIKILIGNQENRDVIFTDVYLCKEETRQRAEEWIKSLNLSIEIKYIFFENDKDKCLLNMKHRMDQGDTREVKGSINMFSKLYKIPEGYEAKKIWQPEEKAQ